MPRSGRMFRDDVARNAPRTATPGPGTTRAIDYATRPRRRVVPRDIIIADASVRSSFSRRGTETICQVLSRREFSTPTALVSRKRLRKHPDTHDVYRPDAIVARHRRRLAAARWISIAVVSHVWIYRATCAFLFARERKLQRMKMNEIIRENVYTLYICYPNNISLSKKYIYIFLTYVCQLLLLPVRNNKRKKFFTDISRNIV